MFAAFECDITSVCLASRADVLATPGIVPGLANDVALIVVIACDPCLIVLCSGPGLRTLPSAFAFVSAFALLAEGHKYLRRPRP